MSEVVSSKEINQKLREISKIDSKYPNFDASNHESVIFNLQVLRGLLTNAYTSEDDKRKAIELIDEIFSYVKSFKKYPSNEFEFGKSLNFSKEEIEKYRSELVIAYAAFLWKIEDIKKRNLEKEEEFNKRTINLFVGSYRKR